MSETERSLSRRRKGFAEFTLAEALGILGRDTLTRWEPPVVERTPSELLQQYLQRIEATFDLRGSEASRMLLVDALLAEVGSDHTELRIWKEAALSTNEVTGYADYIIAPRRDFLKQPLLCVVEAKKDDFTQGTAQCLMEMYACAWNNRQTSQETDIYGIVTNGATWQFYAYTLTGDILETLPYSISDLPGMLGVLDTVLTACANAAQRFK